MLPISMGNKVKLKKKAPSPAGEGWGEEKKNGFHNDLYLFAEYFRRNDMNAGIVTTHIPPAKGYGGVSVTAGVLTKAW